MDEEACELANLPEAEPPSLAESKSLGLENTSTSKPQTSPKPNFDSDPVEQVHGQETKTSNLSAKHITHDQKFQELQAKLRTTTKQAEAYKKRSQSELAKKRAALQTITGDYYRILNANKTLRREHEETCDLLRRSEDANSQRKHALEASRNGTDMCMEELYLLRTEYMEVTDIMATLNEGLRIEQDKSTKLQNELNSEIRSGIRARLGREEAKRQLKEVRKAYMGLHTELDTKQEESKRLRQELDATREASRKVQQELDIEQEEAITREREISSLRWELENSQKALRRKGGELKGFQQALDAEEGKSRNLQQEADAQKEESRIQRSALAVALKLQREGQLREDFGNIVARVASHYTKYRDGVSGNDAVDQTFHALAYPTPSTTHRPRPVRADDGRETKTEPDEEVRVKKRRQVTAAGSPMPRQKRLRRDD